MPLPAILALLFLADPERQATADDPICTAQPSACRTVPPFDLRVGETVHRIAPPGLRPWIRDGRLSLFPGESVVLVVEDDGSIRVESVARAADVLKDDGADQMAAIVEGEGGGATENDLIPSKTGPAIAPPPTDRLRVTFRQSATTDDMFLVLQSGFGDPVSYNAGMIVPQQGPPEWSTTSVCTILPTIQGFEHWPHPILTLSLGGFHVEKGAPPDSYRCA